MNECVHTMRTEPSFTWSSTQHIFIFSRACINVLVTCAYLSTFTEFTYFIPTVDSCCLSVVCSYLL